MDERLDNALKFANYRTTLQQERESLQLKLNEQLIYGFNGGVFHITPELISFTNVLLRKTSTAVLLDHNDLPIEIEDLEEFVDEILSRYVEATNEYYEAYNKIKKARSVKHVLGWNDEN